MIRKVFFYGLFMDAQLLAAKGIEPSSAKMAYVDGFQLRIGERATLIRQHDGRAYGVVMGIAEEQLSALYSETSVVDYVPENVMVQLMDGSRLDATCYNLPADMIVGTNKQYAALLLQLATDLGFPESYLADIRKT